MTNSSLDLQVTQLKYRLSEGNGECFYYIGEHRYGLRPLLTYVLDRPRLCSCRCKSTPSHTAVGALGMRHARSADQRRRPERATTSQY